MLLVTRRISAAAQHYRFQLILISTDVASLSHEAGSFLCKLKLLDQEKDTWKLWNGQNDALGDFQVIYDIFAYIVCSENEMYVIYGLVNWSFWS